MSIDEVSGEETSLRSTTFVLVTTSWAFRSFPISSSVFFRNSISFLPSNESRLALLGQCKGRRSEVARLLELAPEERRLPEEPFEERRLPDIPPEDVRRLPDTYSREEELGDMLSAVWSNTGKSRVPRTGEDSREGGRYERPDLGDSSFSPRGCVR